MTEVNRDELTGETVSEKDRRGYEIKASDLASYVRERQGLPNPEVIIDGESLPPHSVLPKKLNDDKSINSDFDEGMVKITNYKHDDSALAKSIHKSRLAKKAA